MTEKRTELSDLGEFGLIDRIADNHKDLIHKETIKGIGDDAAIIRSSDEIIITSDMLLEGIHFDLSYFPIQHLGYKSIVVNISDIAAMNGIPKQVIVNIGLSNRFSLEAVDVFYQGVKSACKDYKVDLIGGDTTSSASGLIISVTAIGSAVKKHITGRTGAKKGDIICVTGDLGAAYLGLQILEREKQEFLVNPEMQPKLEGYDYLVQRQLKPKARMDIIYDLREKEIVPTSMIDISDGLASETLHLSKQSGLGFRLFEDKLPIDALAYDTAFEFGMDGTTCMLNGGEDYELLFTINKEDQHKLEKHLDIHFIGEVISRKESSVLISKGGKEISLKAQGWTHF